MTHHLTPALSPEDQKLVKEFKAQVEKDCQPPRDMAWFAMLMQRQPGLRDYIEKEFFPALAAQRAEPYEKAGYPAVAAHIRQKLLAHVASA